MEIGRDFDIARDDIPRTNSRTCYNNSTDVSFAKIDLVEKHLRLPEIISMLFLLNDEDDGLYCELLKCLDNNITPNVISKWYLKNQNQLNKLLESLFLMKHFKLLKLLGFNKYDASYIFQHSPSTLSNAKKILYSLCDSMTKDETVEFIKEMNCNPSNYYCLELYFIKWNMTKIISVQEPYKFDTIFNALLSAGKDEYVERLKELERVTEIQENVISSKTAIDEDDAYPIYDCNDVGLCMVINQEIFSDKTRNRAGSQLDVAAITNTMKHFNFEVVCKNNFVSHQLVNYITTTIKSRFKQNHSVLFIFIMSHGVQGAVCGHDFTTVTIDQIKNSIHDSKCLRGRPIVLIIQACQGNKMYSPIETDDVKDNIVPILSNVIVCMTTIPGYLSLRHTKKGSFYIQTLCEVMKKYEYEDIYSIITRVQKVLTNPESFYNKCTFAMLPEFYSRLVKKLYLKKKISIS